MERGHCKRFLPIDGVMDMTGDAFDIGAFTFVLLAPAIKFRCSLGLCGVGMMEGCLLPWWSTNGYDSWFELSFSMTKLCIRGIVYINQLNAQSSTYLNRAIWQKYGSSSSRLRTLTHDVMDKHNPCQIHA